MNTLVQVITDLIAALDAQAAQIWHAVSEVTHDAAQRDEHTARYVEFCMLDELRQDMRCWSSVTIERAHAIILDQVVSVQIDDEMLHGPDSALKSSAIGDREARMFYVTSFTTLLEAAGLPVPAIPARTAA